MIKRGQLSGECEMRFAGSILHQLSHLRVLHTFVIKQVATAVLIHLFGCWITARVPFRLLPLPP